MRTTVVGLATALLLAGVSGAAALGERGTAEVKNREGVSLGNIAIIETTAGILLRIALKGLSPGAHGFHIHDVKKCEGDFASAGNIYNPLGAKHGYLNEEGPMGGDLPNLIADAAGTVNAELLSPFVTLNTDAEETVFDADGASFVVFEKPDDYVSQPEGNAGARIACGSINIAK